MPQTSAAAQVVLGLDVGDARIGVARAHGLARLPEQLAIVPRAEAFDRLTELVAETEAELFVIGIPLGALGTDSEQAKRIRSFAAELAQEVPLPQVFVDESFSSQEADVFLKATSSNKHTVAHNDGIAACIVLERYFNGALHV